MAMAAKMPMMATTIISSMRVKPLCSRVCMTESSLEKGSPSGEGLRLLLRVIKTGSSGSLLASGRRVPGLDRSEGGRGRQCLGEQSSIGRGRAAPVDVAALIGRQRRATDRRVQHQGLTADLRGDGRILDRDHAEGRRT